MFKKKIKHVSARAPCVSQETYLPSMVRSKLKLLLQGEAEQSLLTFVDEAMQQDMRKVLLELQYSQELSLLYLLQDDMDRAKYHIENGIRIFMQASKQVYLKPKKFVIILEANSQTKSTSQALSCCPFPPPLCAFMVFILNVFLEYFFPFCLKLFVWEPGYTRLNPSCSTSGAPGKVAEDGPSGTPFRGDLH